MELTKEQIDRCFKEARHQTNYIVDLYKLVIPDFEDREIIYPPYAGKEVSHYIGEKAIEFDKEHHPDVMAGGAWILGKGFLKNEELGDWEVKEREEVDNI